MTTNLPVQLLLDNTNKKSSKQNINTKSDNKQINTSHHYDFPCAFTWAKFPVFVSLVSILGVLVTYCVARIECHVEDLRIPYISYTGNYAPEHMMFGMLLNMQSVLFSMVIMLVWRFMNSFKPVRKRYEANTCTVGLFSCLGICVVANFQVEKSPQVHYMGAFVAFVCAAIYLILVCQILSVKSKFDPKVIPPVLLKIRWYLCIFCCFSFVCCLLVTSIAPLVPEFKNHDAVTYYKNITNPNCRSLTNKALKQISENDNGETRDARVVPKYTYQYNLIWSIGALFEWLFACGFCVFMALFHVEFQCFQHVKIILKDGERNVLETIKVEENDNLDRKDLKYKVLEMKESDLQYRNIFYELKKTNQTDVKLHIPNLSPNKRSRYSNSTSQSTVCKSLTNFPKPRIKTISF